MQNVTYQLDPKGDVVIELHNPNAAFAVWEDCEESNESPDTDKASQGHSNDDGELDILSNHSSTPPDEDQSNVCNGI
jgi:hypothetical protein